MDQYRDWQNAPDKDLETFYANASFRAGYTVEMKRKAQACLQLIRPEVADLVQCWQSCNIRKLNAWSCSPETIAPLRVLSVGCGPGTDLLAALWVCSESAQLSTGAPLTLNCVGVDKQPWDLSEFKSEFSKTLGASSANFAASWRILQADYETYIHRCIATDQKFDLVISCYTGAKEKLRLLGIVAPRILSCPGRIFVIDNYSRELEASLTPRGFYVSAWPSNDKRKRPIFLVKKAMLHPLQGLHF